MSLIDEYLKDKPELKEAIDTCTISDPVEEKVSPLEVVIKQEALDTSSMEEGKGNKSLFRPKTFAQYIGQENSKEELNAWIDGTKRLDEQFPHTMISGSAGHGKTTLAYILANSLGYKVSECVGNTLRTPQQVVDKIIECEGGILFIDEIHSISVKVAEFLLPVIEDFNIGGKLIKPFTLIGATTEKGVLIKKLKPFVQRFPIQLELEDYNTEHLVTIQRQYKEKLFGNFKIPENIYQRLGENCRATPRVVLSLLKTYIFMQDVEKVLRVKKIVYKGITENDIKFLKYLNSNEKPIGVQAISAYLGTSETNYLYEIEQYLLKMGYILRLPRGRMISDLGKKLLKNLPI